MFKSFYDKTRFNYIDPQIEDSPLFEYSGRELVPKTACFFSDDVDVYVDTSDGVNDDLQIQEYCGRIMSCIRMSKGKRFLFFKAAHSSVWSKNIEKMAAENNGRVVPFFKWSFNTNFYSILKPNLAEIRKKVKSIKPAIDLGLFADFSKKYDYPYASSNDPRISWADIDKFSLHDLLGHERATSRLHFEINSRQDILNKVKESSLTCFHGSLPYAEYIEKSIDCMSVLNPPGVGEYTSRMFDQTAIGNLVILRKNSYDQGLSWKEYIPEIDFTSNNWEQQYAAIVDERSLWQEKSTYYFENCWSPTAVFDFLISEISKEGLI